jgi:hypothetical protein
LSREYHPFTIHLDDISKEDYPIENTLFQLLYTRAGVKNREAYMFINPATQQSLASRSPHLHALDASLESSIFIPT